MMVILILYLLELVVSTKPWNDDAAIWRGVEAFDVPWITPMILTKCNLCFCSGSIIHVKWIPQRIVGNRLGMFLSIMC